MAADAPSIGLIAGSGSFPLEVAKIASERGYKVFAVCHRDETDPALEKLCESCEWIHVGQLSRLLKYLSRFGVKQAIFSGGISRPRLFQSLRVDLKALALIARIGTVKDDVLLRAVANEVEKLGIDVLSAGDFLDKSVARRGRLTRRLPTAQEFSDARIGWEAAKGIGGLEIGQTVVVSKGMVVAVEAIEGTDQAIRRGGELSGPGAVVVKVSKPQQDTRLDLPAVGEGTIDVMAASGATALFLEDQRALILNPDSVINKANGAGIAIFVAGGPSDLDG